MGVVNLLRKDGGHFQPDLGDQYHRILHFDAGEALAEMISPFDTFIQVIEGAAEVIIDEKPNVSNRSSHNNTGSYFQ